LLAPLGDGTEGLSVGDGMNDAGHAVGYSSVPSIGDHATFWDADGNAQDLGLLAGHTASEAFGINNDGVIVGMSIDATFNGHAVVWDSATSSPVDLNTLLDLGAGPGVQLPGATWDLFWATGINDAGQIVGLGNFNGELRGFVATPNVPEPVGAATIVGCVIAYGALRRRRLA
jgi:probable HAF family extracellular repeat protein